MEEIIQSVEPYKILLLHTNIPKHLLGQGVTPPKDDIRKDGAWKDGYHYIGTLRDYCFGKNNDVLVIVEPFFEIESDDRKYKWHRINDKFEEQFICRFEGCTVLGEINKPRARFKSALNELIILSSDPSDTKTYDWLTGKIKDEDA